jgi:peptidoglycan-associated lipoprotein
MKPTRLLLIVLLLPCFVYAQRNLINADRAFESQQYYLADDLYAKATAETKDKVKKARIIFQRAECARYKGDFDVAMKRYGQAVTAGYTDDIVYLRWAQMQQMNGQYAEAILNYTEYKKRVPSDAVTADAGIAACNNASGWISSGTGWMDLPVTRWDFRNEAELNTKTNDFCPTWADRKHQSLVISSKRPGQSGSSIDPNSGTQYSDLFEAKKSNTGKWSTPSALQGNVNLPSSNDGASCITKNGTHIFFTRCDQQKKQLITCKIYFAEKKGNTWGAPVLIDFGLDAETLENFNFRHPAVSVNEDVMVFSSDMPGVSGGVHSDLWMSTFDKKTKTWSKPVNLGGTINTSAREGFPYINDAGDLFFSSDGHQGMGGLDIFRAPKVAGAEWKWDKPENLKMPFNSPADDFGIVFNGKLREGYLTSNRPGTKGYDDIWFFRYKECKVPLTGFVRDTTYNLPLANAVVVLTFADNTTEIQRTKADGSYSFIVSENETFVVSVELDSLSASVKAKNYFSVPSSQNKKFTTVGLIDCPVFKHDFEAAPIPDKDIAFPAVLYGLDSATLRSQSKDSLDYLYRLLIENPHMVIEIDAHTDCQGSSAHNRDLAQRRAQACVDYLVKEKGIAPERLVAKGWGEDAPLKLPKGQVLTEKYINSRPAKEREALHQLNRRTTFRVIRNDYVDPKAPKTPIREVKVRKGYFDETGVEEPAGDGVVQPLENNPK